MTQRLAILSALLLGLAACQSVGAPAPTDPDCGVINDQNRDRCNVGIQ